MGLRPRNGWLIAGLAGLLTGLASCGGGDALAPQSVASVTVAPTPVSVTIGGTVQLTATVRDADGNVLLGHAVAWTTSDPAKAKVSATGLATGIAGGAVTVSAASEGKSGSAQVMVGSGSGGQVAALLLSPSPSSVILGGTIKFIATVKSVKGDTLKDEPVSWTSNNQAVAPVEPDGTVRGLLPGTATITASAGGKTALSELTVSTTPVATVTITPGSASTVIGDTVRFTAVAKDADGNVLVGRQITWRTNNPSIALPCEDGLTTGTGVGTATITATSEGVSGTAAITVGQAPVATVTVSPATASISAGASVQLAATLTDANGYELSGRAISWTTADAGIATVSSSGLVAGVSGGTVTITASSEGKSGTAQVTVIGSPTPGPVATVEISPSAAMVAANGGKVQLAATLKDASGIVITGQSVTWSSSSGNATVSSSGLVTGVTLGSATITATSGNGKSSTAQITVSRAAGVYGTQGYCSSNSYRRMDVYVPAASFARPLPVAVFAHGGAWTSGDKSTSGWRFTMVKDELLKRGYIIANLNYRLATATTNKWPAQINDVKCAVRSLRGNASTWGSDPARFGAWGVSAGATLTDLLATTDPSDGLEGPDWTSQTSRVLAAVDMSGPTDLTRPGELHFDYSQVFTTWPDSTSFEFFNASPVSHASADDGPFLIYHADGDATVDLAQAQRLQSRLQAAHGSDPNSAQLIMVTNATHSMDPLNGGSISPSQATIVQQVANFFDGSVKNAVAPTAFIAFSIYSETGP